MQFPAVLLPYWCFSKNFVDRIFVVPTYWPDTTKKFVIMPRLLPWFPSRSCIYSFAHSPIPNPAIVIGIQCSTLTRIFGERERRIVQPNLFSGRIRPTLYGFPVDPVPKKPWQPSKCLGNPFSTHPDPSDSRRENSTMMIEPPARWTDFTPS